MTIENRLEQLEQKVALLEKSICDKENSQTNKIESSLENLVQMEKQRPKFSTAFIIFISSLLGGIVLMYLFTIASSLLR